MILCSPYADLNDLAACHCPESSPTVSQTALEVASEILYGLTGRQFAGLCEAVLRPCGSSGGLSSASWSTWSYPWYPIRQGGAWVNTGPCGCHVASDCACSSYPRVDLGRADIQSVEVVTLEAEVLDAGAYRLDEHRYLTREDGGGWPCCQHLGRPLGEPGTWSIELTYGEPAPASLVQATATLATEYVKACVDDETCRLPAQTQTIARQGVTIQLSDPTQYLAAGLTGIAEVDLIVKALNPAGISRQAVVRSPEVRSAGLWSS
jgi:hypothetical protein